VRLLKSPLRPAAGRRPGSGVAFVWGRKQNGRQREAAAYDDLSTTNARRLLGGKPPALIEVGAAKHTHIVAQARGSVKAAALEAADSVIESLRPDTDEEEPTP